MRMQKHTVEGIVPPYCLLVFLNGGLVLVCTDKCGYHVNRTRIANFFRGCAFMGPSFHHDGPILRSSCQSHSRTTRTTFRAKAIVVIGT